MNLRAFVDTNVWVYAVDTGEPTKRSRAHGDSLIVAAASAAGCTVVISEDMAHGATYGSVRIENPFAAAPGADEPAISGA